MDLKSLARKNVKNRANRYFFYILTYMAVVCIYFILDNFSRLDLKKCELEGLEISNISGAVIILKIILLIYFAVFSIYSNRELLNSRANELSLLALYGFDKRNMKKYLLIEGIFMVITFVLGGLVLGALLSKLYFMIMSVILYKKIGLEFSMLSFIKTTFIFSIIYVLLRLMSIKSFNNSEIVEKKRDYTARQKRRDYSSLKGRLGFLLWILSIYLALTIDRDENIMGEIFFISTVAILSSYYIFKDYLIHLTSKNKRSLRFLFEKENYMVLKNLSYNFSKLYKILYISCLINTISLVLLSGIVTAKTEAIRITGFNTYNDLGFVVENRIDKDNHLEVEEYISRNKIDLENKVDIDGLSFKKADKKYFILDQTRYNKILTLMDGPKLNIKKGHLVYNDSLNMRSNDLKVDKITEDKDYALFLEDFQISGRLFLVDEEYTGSPIGISQTGYTSLLILNDEDYLDLKKDFEPVRYIGYNLKNREESQNVEIVMDIYSEKSFNNYSTIVDIQKNNSLLGLFSMLMCIIIYLSSNSILYFEFFTDLRYDRKNYLILRDLGLSRSSIDSIIYKKAFFTILPSFFVSVINSYLILYLFIGGVGGRMLINWMLIVALYGVLQMVGVRLLRFSYTRNLQI